MKYKIIKEVEVDSETDSLMDAAAHCILDLLYDRFNDDKIPAFLKDEEFSINYDFSLYGEDLSKRREEKGYTVDKFITSADSFIRRL